MVDNSTCGIVVFPCTETSLGKCKNKICHSGTKFKILLFVFVFFLAIRLCANNVLSCDLEAFSCSSFFPPEVDQPRMRAQALSDHDAETKDELSLMAYEVNQLTKLTKFNTNNAVWDPALVAWR